MWLHLYNFSISAYAFLIRCAAFFYTKAKKLNEGQKTVFSALENTSFQHPIWIHCASVGEFEQGLPLYYALEKEYPKQTFLFTFFSPSGYEYAKKKFPDFSTVYLPIDTKKNALRCIQLVQPKAVFFIKYEFWFHYLHQLNRHQIPVFLISGIFRKQQPFFKWYGVLHRQMLSYFHTIFVQNEASKSLLKSIHLENVILAGDTRFDRVKQLKEEYFQDEIVEQFIQQSPVFIAGSVWQNDETILSKIIRYLPVHWKIILAPHEPMHYDTRWLENRFVLYSNFSQTDKQILVLDSIGKLSRIYRFATFAYIGGGYGKGIHNCLEAVVYRIPVFFGPSYSKFQEAIDLLEKGVAFCTADLDLENTLHETINDTDKYSEIQLKAALYIEQNANVGSKIVVFLQENKLLNEVKSKDIFTYSK